MTLRELAFMVERLRGYQRDANRCPTVLNKCLAARQEVRIDACVEDVLRQLIVQDEEEIGHGVVGQ